MHLFQTTWVAPPQLISERACLYFALFTGLFSCNAPKSYSYYYCKIKAELQKIRKMDPKTRLQSRNKQKRMNWGERGCMEAYGSIWENCESSIPPCPWPAPMHITLFILILHILSIQRVVGSKPSSHSSLQWATQNGPFHWFESIA